MAHISHHQLLMVCVSLFLAPFAHENIEIVMAAACIHKLQLSPCLVVGCLYAGVVAGDVILFFGQAGAVSAKISTLP